MNPHLHASQSCAGLDADQIEVARAGDLPLVLKRVQWENFCTLVIHTRQNNRVGALHFRMPADMCETFSQKNSPETDIIIDIELKGV